MDILRDIQTMTWLYIGGGALLLVILVAFWRKLLRAVMILAGLGIALALAWTLAMQSTATKEVATAATVSAAGSTAGNIAATLLAFLLAVVTIVAGTYIFLLRRRIYTQRLQDPSAMSWTPQGNLTPPSDALGALIQIEVLKALRELRTDNSVTLAPYVAWDKGEDAGEPYREPDDPMWWR
jgi:hypothetical protein